MAIKIINCKTHCITYSIRIVKLPYAKLQQSIHISYLSEQKGQDAKKLHKRIIHGEFQTENIVLLRANRILS